MEGRFPLLTLNRVTFDLDFLHVCVLSLIRLKVKVGIRVSARNAFGVTSVLNLG